MIKLTHIISESLKNESFHHLSKGEKNKIDSLLLIMKKHKAGKKYKDALNQLIKLAKTKTDYPVTNRREALSVLDYEDINESVSDKRLAFASKNKGKLVSKDDELFEDVIDKLIKLADKHFNIVSKNSNTARPLTDGRFLKVRISGEEYKAVFNKFVMFLTGVKAVRLDNKGGDFVYYFPLDKELK